MKKDIFLPAGAALVLLSVLLSLPVRKAHGQDSNTTHDFVAPIVFQAAGPTGLSIQGTITEYRTALGDPNGNNGPKETGRREINWDGANNNTDTAVGGNPLPNFLVTRGALISTPDGTGFVQATPDGLAQFFNNPTYATIFRAFSQFRLFSAIGGSLTDVDFFVPGGGNVPALTRGFGAVFTDVDQPDGSGPGVKNGNRKSSTLIEYFGASGELLFSSFVPAAPGNGGQSFLGIVFPDPRIARVRITSGDAAPGPDDDGKLDIVVMDDFIYGEPRPLP